MACSVASILNYILLILVLVLLSWKMVEASGTFEFDIHHRHSDSVRAIFDVDGFPEKGSYDYYAAMAHRDAVIRRRRMAQDTPKLIFEDGNDTYRADTLAFLHYANVSVGTPSLNFLVALDTGSDLFWLPCGCTNCPNGLRESSGEDIVLNMYDPNTSSTSVSVLCDSPYCQQKNECFAASDACPYEIRYLSKDTSSSGFLVEDVLHLSTDDNKKKAVQALIKFGCGTKETGTFLGPGPAAPNGLFGLGMEMISVPSILASQGLAADSFSMCFGPDQRGRIKFGDKGSSDQLETPFIVDLLNPTYSITITQISVDDSVTDLNLNAVVDSGTSFTSLTDPAYTIISKNFHSKVHEKRLTSKTNLPFEYCYILRAKRDSFQVANVNLTMKGGKQFFVTEPTVYISAQRAGYIYCLGVIKSNDIDIIGQNFMTGYNMVFDREKLVLGWKASDCYDGNKTPSASSIKPQSTGPVNHSARMTSFGHTLLVLFWSLFAQYLTLPF